MRRLAAGAATVATLLAAPVAFGQAYVPAPAPPAGRVELAPAPPPPAPPPPAVRAPQVIRAPGGEWVYTAEYGWILVPIGTAAVVEEGVPYAYLYSPRLGWNWYVSPWGYGRFAVGPWVWHPWHPRVYRGWVAPPRVVTRLGRPYWREGRPYWRR